MQERHGQLSDWLGKFSGADFLHQTLFHAQAFGLNVIYDLLRVAFTEQAAIAVFDIHYFIFLNLKARAKLKIPIPVPARKQNITGTPRAHIY